MRSCILWSWIVIMAMVSVGVCGCDSNTVYFHFCHTPLSGWEKNDTLTFSVPGVRLQGSYNQEIMLRTTDEFPYKSISLIVEQTILPAGHTTCDTIKCMVSDNNGNIKGNGISIYQNQFKTKNLKLNANDSLHIKIRHAMRREMMPGVSDVGIRISMDQ